MGIFARIFEGRKVTEARVEGGRRGYFYARIIKGRMTLVSRIPFFRAAEGRLKASDL